MRSKHRRALPLGDGHTPTAALPARGWALLLLGAIAALLLFPRAALPAAADGPAPSGQREIRIERSLGCPQCTDVPLDVCDQDICRDMRAIIDDKVQAGESDQAIRAYFVDRYGPRVLLSPPKSGSNLADWLVPFAGLAVGAALTVGFLRAARRRERTSREGRHGMAATVYRLRVERDLQELE